MKLFDLPNTEADAIKLLQELGIVQMKRICHQGHAMKLSIGKKITWECYKSTCRGNKVGIRTSNFFENTRLPFVSAVRFFYNWAHEYTSIRFCKHELGMSDETTVDWSMYMREACVMHLTSRPEQAIGGEGKWVEIDESLGNLTIRLTR